MAKKLYFTDDNDENCYQIDYFKDYLIENDLKEIVLVLAVRETGTGYFFCKEYFCIGETGECGRACDGYKPNNGKNGRCKHYGYCYDMTEQKFLLKRVGKKLFKVERYTPLEAVSSIA